MKYTIAKYNHFSTPIFPILAFGKKDEFTAEFSKECVHFQRENDVHKLWGRSNKWDRQIDSLRIGWRSDGELIELFAFEHLPSLGYGVERITKIGYCYASQKVRFKIQYFNESTNIFLSGKYVFKSNFISKKINFKCRPYYGGTITAPTDMSIVIS